MAKKEVRSFSYQKRTKDDLKERANMKGGNFDTYIKPKFKQWKPKDGKNLIRILPPTWDGARHYGLDIYINFNIGPDNQSYLSLSKHEKGPDPLAEARREAQHEGDKELTKALTPNQRILYWIIDRNDEEEGPLLWSAPFTFDKSLSNLCIDEDTKEVIFIDDPAKGRDVRFYKEGTGLTTKYDPSKMKVLADSSIHEDEGIENDWLDFISDNPLPDVLNFYDYDHIKASFDGQIGKRDDDEKEEKPARRSTRSTADEDEPKARPAPRKRAEQAEPEEDEAPPSRQRRRVEAEAEDDEPAPRARGRARNNDSDDEEVEEKPRSSRRVVEEDDESPPLTRRTKPSNDDDEEGGGSLRERLARRRSRVSDDD